MIYMCTRLMVNVTQVYIPLYMLEVVNLDRVSSYRYLTFHPLIVSFYSPVLPKPL